jgi:hypothetical protein
MVQQHSTADIIICALHYYVRERASAGTKNINVYVCILSRRSLFPSSERASAAPPFIFGNEAALPKLPLVRRRNKKASRSSFTLCVNKAPFNLATSAGHKEQGALSLEIHRAVMKTVLNSSLFSRRPCLRNLFWTGLRKKSPTPGVRGNFWQI